MYKFVKTCSSYPVLLGRDGRQFLSVGAILFGVNPGNSRSKHIQDFLIFQWSVLKIKGYVKEIVMKTLLEKSVKVLESVKQVLEVLKCWIVKVLE